MSKRVLVAAPRSFCAGVVRAIDIVEKLLEQHGPPVYVRHEIVHNVHVVRDLEARGAVFVESEDDVPEGALDRSLRARRRTAGLREVRGTRAQGRRRRLPARLQGACGGAPLRGPRSRRSRSSATRATSRSRGRWGRRRESIVLRGDARRRAQPRGRGGRAGRLHHSDHAFARRHGRRRRRAARALPGSRRATLGGHLLRDAEPPGCGQAHLRGGDARARRRLAHELEREPARRGRARPWRRCLSDRRRDRPRPRLARRATRPSG